MGGISSYSLLAKACSLEDEAPLLQRLLILAKLFGSVTNDQDREIVAVWSIKSNQAYFREPIGVKENMILSRCRDFGG